MKKILHLNLKKKWFDLIANNKKKIEYREIKHYWTIRVMELGTIKVFDEIYFKNGFARNGKEAPFMRVQWLGMERATFEGKKCYAIILGEILGIRNYQIEGNN